jgi:hypothetical protein
MRLRKRTRKIGTGNEIELGGQDSFLDLVSNIVGILIILVMVAGIRAQFSSANIPDSQTLAELQTKYQELQTKTETLTKQRFETEEVQVQSELVAEQLQRQSMEYAALFDLMTSARAAIETAAEEKSQTFKEKIEYQRQLLETNAKLEQIAKTKTALRQVRPQATILENIPTPLSKTVEEKEIHFRLLGGKIVYVPFPELIQQWYRHVSEEQNRYIKQQTNMGKVGPVENFEFEFLLVTYGSSVSGGFRLQYGEFVPKHELLGEPIRTALASPQSEFRRKISRYMKDYTVTVWVYPDSFEEYQDLKRFLYDQGYSVAARPMPMGHPIALSPHGTKSAAQ